MSRMNRRQWLATGMAASGLPVASASAATGVFSIQSFQNQRKLLATPDGKPFFALSFNHIDSSALRYEENLHIWRERYGASEERWIRERVAPDLRDWGFNSIGWTQDVVVREPNYHWHSERWTRDHYNWAGLPYFHVVPFFEPQRWKLGAERPDVFSEEFARWCEFVARENCAALADDPNLIGYYFADVPLLTKGGQLYKKKQTWFDPADLQSEEGRKRVSREVRQYYKVTTAALRRYDPNHLVFGDRYNLAAPLPEPVLDAAAEYVDAIAVQLAPKIEETAAVMNPICWRTGKPFIVADATHTSRPAIRMAGTRHDPKKYALLLNSMKESSECIGVNLCGGFVRNRVRRKGVYDEQENPDLEAVEGFRQSNREITEWYSELG